MSLLSLGQQIFDGARQLFDGLQKPNATGANDGSSETQRSAPVGFWSNLFGGKNTTTPNFTNAGLNFTAQSVNLSGNEIETQNSREAARFNPTSQTKEWKEGVQADGTYISKISPKDLGKARWSKEIDPADISRVALEKTAVGTGIAGNAEEAKQIVGNLKVNRLKTQTNKGERSVDKSDVGFAQWMKQRTDREGRWTVQTPTEQIALLRDSARELKIGNPDVALALPTDATQQADAGALLAGALALPKIAKELPKAVVLAGEAVPPLLIITGGVLGASAVVHQHVGVVKSNWEDALKATRMPLPMNMDDAEPMPQPVPDGKPKERPYANPQAPTMPDVGTAPQAKPGELVKPEAQAKPQTKAQPQTTEQPTTQQPTQNNTPQSPKNLDRVIPPIIAGASLGKLAADKMNNTDVAPNGVEKIQKREWSKAEYKQWFDNLHTIKTPHKTAADIYEVKHTGELNYSISGNGEKFNADGISSNNVLEAKCVINPDRSLFIKDSKLPDFLRKSMEEKGIRSELSRLSKILRDDSNPLTSVQIITNNEKAVPYLTELMKEYNVPGEVVVKQ